MESKTILKGDKRVTLLEYLASDKLFKALTMALPDDITREDLDKGLTFDIKYDHPLQNLKVKTDGKGNWTRDIE